MEEGKGAFKARDVTLNGKITKEAASTQECQRHLPDTKITFGPASKPEHGVPGPSAT